jgi:mono/diheme cytochrome c family protein
VRALRFVLFSLALLVIAAGIFLWRAQWPLIDKIEPPERSAFAPALIEKGARLAAVGDCHVCHTAEGGEDYAGNRPIPTPFGTIFSTNITPASGSGIGHWSETTFRRAMRDGISRTGRHLYPAFPYPHFARLDDADITALYAFLMTRQPVETTQLPPRLRFPFDQRWLMSFWNLLFFHPAPFRPDPDHDAEWNRGAYLVESLGHCGDCHTPHGLLGAEEMRRGLTGGDAEGWAAPALDAASPAPERWTAPQLFGYLRQGWEETHGAAAGPMQPVAAALADADPPDVRAIADYIGAQEARPSERREPMPPPDEEPHAALFVGACARCHVAGAAMLPPHGIDLVHSTVVNEPDPRDAILIVLDGIRQPPGQAGPFMPGFAGSFTDAQIAELLSYVRARYGAGPAWTDLEQQVRNLRHR